jgi:hypothetical protein
MKKWLAIIAAQASLTTPVFADQKPDPEYWYVGTVTVTRIFMTYCSEYYEFVGDDTLSNFAKDNGLNADELDDAITAAFNFYAGHNYDASKIRRTPTLIVKGVAAEILDLYDRGGKPFLFSAPTCAPTIGARSSPVSTLSSES